MTYRRQLQRQRSAPCLPPAPNLDRLPPAHWRDSRGPAYHCSSHAKEVRRNNVVTTLNGLLDGEAARCRPVTGSTYCIMRYRRFGYPGWLFSIDHGATCIWKRWDGWTPEHGFHDPGMNFFAHYSFGAVDGWMAENLGGIRAIDPVTAGSRSSPCSIPPSTIAACRTTASADQSGRSGITTAAHVTCRSQTRRTHGRSSGFVEWILVPCVSVAKNLSTPAWKRSAYLPLTPPQVFPQQRHGSPRVTAG